MFNSYDEEEVRYDDDFENTEVNSRIAGAYANASLSMGQLVCGNQFALIRENDR